MPVNHRNLIKECVLEVLQENLSETSTPHPHAKTKADVYALLEKAGFRKEGQTPRDYMEYYLSGFATVFCMVRLDANENEVLIQRYYDSERMDTMTGNHIEKSMPLPEAYSPEFVKEVVKECLRLQRSVRGDESIFGGMDDVGEGFDPQSQGPNPVDDTGNPYAKWNSDMQKMEENKVCSQCNGSGEGRHEGAKCTACHGSGEAGYKPALTKHTDPDYDWDKDREEKRLGLDETIELTPTGEDDWSRPVYTDQNGKTYVDINLGNGTPSIHSVTDQGEPDVPITNFKLVGSTPQNKHPNALCPRCKNSKPELMKKTPDGKVQCTSCHAVNEWETLSPERRKKQLSVRPPGHATKMSKHRSDQDAKDLVAHMKKQHQSGQQ